MNTPRESRIATTCFVGKSPESLRFTVRRGGTARTRPDCRAIGPGRTRDRDRRHGTPPEYPDLSGIQTERGGYRRFDQRGRHRRASRSQRDRSAAENPRRGDRSPVRSQRHQPLLGRRQRRHRARPHAGAQRAEWPRRVQRPQYARLELRRRARRADGGRRRLQESFRGHDRRRHRRHGQPAYSQTHGPGRLHRLA